MSGNVIERDGWRARNSRANWIKLTLAMKCLAVVP